MKCFRLNDYWDYLFQQSDYEELFEKKLPRNKMIELFNKYVIDVSIEISAACNRKCNYCPMSKIDRKQAFMPDVIWNRIIEELAEIKYTSRIYLALYNEPLLDPSLPQKIYEIKEKLPDVLSVVHSNGDFLTKELLDIFAENGLGRLLVTRHTMGGV